MLIGIDASRAFALERTGTENYSYELITHILRLPRAKKQQFVLFTRPGSRVPSEIMRYSNVRVRELAWPYLWTQGALAWETHKLPLDLLWIPAHTLPVLRNSRVKTVVTIHGLEYRWLPEYHNWLQRWYLPLSTYYAAKAADRLIAVSESTKRDLLAETQIDIEKITVIYEGVRRRARSTMAARSAIARVEQRYGIEAGRYLLFVGTVQPRKNLEALIAAFARFYSGNLQYRLVIAGSVGWQAEKILRAPEKYGVTESVVFTGRVSAETLDCLYLGAKMYIQPSWTEGFGLPVAEAMSLGVPVIVSDGGALPEVVGDAGRVVKLRARVGESTVEFERELAQAMSKIVQNKAEAANQVKRGLVRAKELSWEKAAKETLDYLLV